MTNAQVFRWFCKEQGITHLIHRMYSKIQPRKLEYVGSELKDRYLSFDEYVDDMVEAYGFQYLLDRIVCAYKSKIRIGMIFSDYCALAVKLTNDFRRFNRKWEYFAKKNIELNEAIRIGDIISFKDWNEMRTMKVTNTDFYQSRIYGTIISLDRNWNGRAYATSFSNVIDENGNKIKQNYIIRRNKRVYHGANSR